MGTGATSGTGGTATAMRGAGYYSAHTIGAKTVIDKVGDRVVAAVARMPRLEPGRPPSTAPTRPRSRGRR